MRTAFYFTGNEKLVIVNGDNSDDELLEKLAKHMHKLDPNYSDDPSDYQNDIDDGAILMFGDPEITMID